jgi:hypothetical protein
MNIEEVVRKPRIKLLHRLLNRNRRTNRGFWNNSYVSPAPVSVMERVPLGQLFISVR